MKSGGMKIFHGAWLGLLRLVSMSAAGQLPVIQW